nr:hypothetical protein Q903MT_gene1423 [Picea sitchensis]
MCSVMQASCNMVTASEWIAQFMRLALSAIWDLFLFLRKFINGLLFLRGVR